MQEVVIKRLVCWGLLLLLIFPVLTCDHFAPGGGGGEGDYDPDGITYTDVVYSPDGKSVTIYLDGTTVPVTNRQSRALSRELAIAGHDYFEVAFYGSGEYVRAAWELRTKAHVRNVPKVNYMHTSVGAVGTNEGAAILFVGKKTDRTILGLGRLIEADGGGAPTEITANTKTVTFKVAALDCGVKPTTNVAGANPPTSFYTDFDNPGPDSSPNQGDPIVPGDWNNVTIPPPLNSKSRVDAYTFSDSTFTFPLYRLVEGSITHARYYFRTVGAVGSGTLFGDFTDGIIQAGVGNYEKKQPRYPIPSGGFQEFSVRLDDQTVITPGNNGSPGSAFQNPVEVKFDTSTTVRGSIFAFVFEIPVFPLSPNASPGRWYIRASYDSYWWDLDDGLEYSRGGAVLIGMGETEWPSKLRIKVVSYPNKYLYNGALSASDLINYGRDLFVDGMKVVVEDALTNQYIGLLNVYTDLTYKVGNKATRPNGAETLRNGELLPSTMYGIQEIVVEYRDPYSGIPYSDSFMIICDDNTFPGRYTDIPDYHYQVVNSISDIQNLESTFGSKRPAGAPIRGTYVIVFTNSVDVADIDFHNSWSSDTESSLLILVAANNNLIIGRNGTGTNSCFRFEDTSPAIFIGKWPFREEIRLSNITYTHNEDYIVNSVIIASNPHTTYGFTINADGPYTDVSGDPPDAPPLNIATKFLHTYRATGGRLYNITVDDSVNIAPIGTTQLY